MAEETVSGQSNATESVANHSKTPSQAQIEGVKLIYDYLKHLTTLSTGSIVVIGTFWSKATSSVHVRWAASASLIFFVISILGALVAEGVLATRAEDGNFSSTTGMDQEIEGWAAFVSMIAFLLAVSALAVFGGLNLMA